MNPHGADQQLCAGPAKSLLGINLKSAVTEPLIFSAAASAAGVADGFADVFKSEIVAAIGPCGAAAAPVAGDLVALNQRRQRGLSQLSCANG